MWRSLRGWPIGLVLILAAMPAGAAGLTLKRVMLSSGGVGYFEYEATVDGDATLTLDVALDQVDDVLKSLMVYDDAGQAGAITLPGREPLKQSFADLPFDQSALASATELLNALQGAEIRLTGDAAVTGRLIRADEQTARNSDGTSETRLRLTVLTDGGLRQVAVEDPDKVEFTDPAVQNQIRTALSRIAAYRTPGRRPLTLAVRGNGKHTVRVGYVVAMPLWKASYRLLLPAEANAGAARLQGWAVLENFSGQAWSDVELTLLSGNPVTFRQALYESYYLTRPLVPVESGGRVLPPPDTGTLADETTTRSENEPADRTKAPARATQRIAGMPMPAAAPPPAPPAPASLQPAAAAEDATQVAFTLPYKISVATGQSLVVPLIDRDLPTRRVDLYQQASEATHPLAAIELTNAADTALPPGVLTLYQQDNRGAEYLGDARLAGFPSGDKRLLSYAVDNKVTIDRTAQSQQSIVKATAAEGVMKLTRLRRQTTTYHVSSAAPPPRLVIEHPRLADWTLTAPADKVERTASAYRLPAALDGKGNGTVTVVEERPVEEQIRLADVGDDWLGVLIAAKELDPKVHQALADLVQRRQAVSRRKAERDRLNEERGRLIEDETRLRDNYTALKDEPSLKKLTLDKLTQAEAAIDANTAATAKATTALASAESDLAAYIGALKL